ncbi:hypothetical protein INS49_010570 [Diaporthe citri]|uniref:uncharacterized protein n=1 Tax=Diaporthe citri TaxID=83186 RepID=UPI001C7E9BA2|nr:uncharacterized protein INS49_010570 [Diaporthe citri]KAG6362340.1 hypothetical protein INS49_010570 [Diaporthe citri]
MSNLHNLVNVMMHRKNNERSLRAALDGTRHKITKKHAAVEASGLNQCVRDTSVEDLDFHFERLKLDLEVLNLPFEGVVNIANTEEIAMKLATEASEAAFDPTRRFFSTHGATGRGDEAGLLAISRCLSLAATDLLRTPYQQRAPKITVFTHYKDALRRLEGARGISTSQHTDSTTEQVQATPALVEVIKKSRFLCRKLGARLELQWMPHHATDTERHRQAEAAPTSQKPMPASKTLPSFQRLRRDQNLTSSQRAFHRRELAHQRRSCRGQPSPLARQANSASSTEQQAQAEPRHLIVENLRELRI